MAQNPPSLPTSSEEWNQMKASIQKELTETQHAIQNNVELQLPWMKEVIGTIMEAPLPPFRTIVLALSARLFAYQGNDLAHVASVLEYLNMAARIHQDIVLTEEVRRKQETLSGIWENEASVLLGDYLLSISFKTMTRLGNFELLDMISQTTQSIARGQVLSISPFSAENAEAHSLAVLQNRNASLFEAGAKSGAILGEATAQVQQSLSEYGLHLGLGIQLKNDLLLVQHFKTLRVALENQHVLFPLCYLMEQMHHKGDDFLKKILEQKQFSDSQLHKLHSYFQQYGVYEYTHQRIEFYLQQSKQSLHSLAHLDTVPLLDLSDCLHSFYSYS